MTDLALIEQEARRLTIEDIIEREQEAGVMFGPFHRNWLLERAPEKVRRNLEMARRYPNLAFNTRQGFAGMDVYDFPGAAFAALNTSVAELNIVGATQALINQFCAIPAMDARAGKVYKVNFGGLWGNTGTPTIIWTPRWGSSTTPATNITLGASPTATTVTGATALAYYGEFIFGIRTSPPGATLATGIGTGFVIMQIPVTSSQYGQVIPMGNTAATIDATGQGAAGCGLTINATWGTSSVSNTTTCNYYILRSLN